MATEIEYTRLYITPFNTNLLNTIIPASVLPHARNISYHTIQTFPERGYGYVDLPLMEAEKIKKKLNGSILKGAKIKIDKARPQKEVVIETEEERVEKPKKEKKKRKRDELPGVDIGERHVKRGWTTPGKEWGKKKKDRTQEKEKSRTVVKSKFTTSPECLFKTVLPPNVASRTTTTEARPEKKRKRKDEGSEAVVHEFAKTTKYATFLKGSAGSKKSKAVTEFVEGKGWVDEDGSLVEEDKTSKKQKQLKSKAPSKRIPQPVADEEDSTSEEKEEEKEVEEAEEQPAVEFDRMTVDHNVAESDEELAEGDNSTSSDEGEVQNAGTAKVPRKNVVGSSSDSSDSDSVSDSATSSSSDSSDSEIESAQSATKSRPQSSSGPALSIKIPDSTMSDVHPLEALYKKPKLKNTKSAPSEHVPSFSFFGTDNDHDDIGSDASDVHVEKHIQIPLTPFTQRDFEYRGIRSAAPTPDTAHPNKQRFIWPVSQAIEEGDEGDEHQPSSPSRRNEGGGMSKGKGKGKEVEEEKKVPEESEFQKWFWENRGELNRAWKRRRKAAAKEKRQKENRKRRDG